MMHRLGDTCSETLQCTSMPALLCWCVHLTRQLVVWSAGNLTRACVCPSAQPARRTQRPCSLRRAHTHTHWHSAHAFLRTRSPLNSIPALMAWLGWMPWHSELTSRRVFYTLVFACVGMLRCRCQCQCRLDRTVCQMVASIGPWSHLHGSMQGASRDTSRRAAAPRLASTRTTRATGRGSSRSTLASSISGIPTSGCGPSSGACRRSAPSRTSRSSSARSVTSQDRKSVV